MVIGGLRATSYVAHCLLHGLRVAICQLQSYLGWLWATPEQEVGGKPSPRSGSNNLWGGLRATLQQAGGGLWGLPHGHPIGQVWHTSHPPLGVAYCQPLALGWTVSVACNHR